MWAEGQLAAVASTRPAVVPLIDGLQLGSVFAQAACRVCILSDVTGDRIDRHLVGRQFA